MKPQLRDSEGREVTLDSLRPTAHHAVLDAAVQRMIGAGSTYRSNVAAEKRRLNFTADGDVEMRRGHGRKALGSLADAYKQARTQAVGLFDLAAEKYANSIKTRVKVDATTTPILVALAAQLKADPVLRNRLVQMVQNNAVTDFADVELLESGATMPLSLTGLTMRQKADFRAYIVPEEREQLARADEALKYVEQLAGTILQSITEDSRLTMADADPVLVDAVSKINTRIAATLPERMQTSPPAEPPVDEQPDPPAEDAVEEAELTEEQ